MTTSTSFLNIRSEIGRLKAVMLHRPGRELERITPQYLHELLFEDIPWLKRMQEEHDLFAKVLRDSGCQVFYYQELLAEIMEDPKVKEHIIREVLEKAKISNPDLELLLKEFLVMKSAAHVAEICIAGLHKNDFFDIEREKRLVDYIKQEYPFYINPLPNLYFTRDPGTVIGHGLSINSMHTLARDRETMILKYIYDFHPEFKKGVSPLLYNYDRGHSIEGGDVLVLGESIVAIGCSERTSPRGIEELTMSLFQKDEKIREVIVIQIPSARAYMHLDTVLTMIDHDKFIIYPGVEEKVRTFRLTPGKKAPRVESMKNLQTALKESLGLSSIEFLRSGGGDEVTAAREQWNDSTNTLAIEPGVVVTYNRNEASNETLRKGGIKVIEIEGSELVRGRGGPRCMSMPLVREEI